ncbi:MAG: 3-deoxy-7-phosphoheptulonate synthase class II [Hyphomicrobiaceae bacterium]|nr:MAG: 3-deoxy-7-phosphoheptulonate synthase class II [Hyphomicrobiaceae bacterium]
MPAAWKLDSWRSKPIVQVPDYPDQAALEEVTASLRNFPPLVFVKEVQDLKQRLAGVVGGSGFLLQGGDCAESFREHKTDYIRDYFQLFLQMALILTFAGNTQVVKVGRVAGQFAKPRSSPTEKQGGKELPSYRGDIVNGPEFTAEARVPDPRRQLQAYRQSAATLNFLRALLDGGYASLDNAHRWELKFMEGTPVEARYDALADEIKRTVEVNRLLGMTAENTLALRTTSFYTSHEALLLSYEQALTRKDEAMGSGQYVATSAHMLWIGDRTRQPDGAHVEFCRGIINPIGLKCGPSLEPDELLRLIDILNPDDEPGRLTLIGRFGATKIEKHLPKLIRAVKKAGRTVVWECDPMHGNTITAATGYKTRPFDSVVSEVEQFFAVHRAEGTYPGGVHVEMTGQNVTECTGGATKISEADLARQYDTGCDPRLNAGQSLELAFRIAEHLKHHNGAGADVPKAAAE